MESTHGSAVALEATAAPPSLQALEPSKSESPVRIRIQRACLSAVSFTLLAAVVALMALCADGGITLDTFDSTERDRAAQASLVSDYNSYSGYLVSALTQAIDLFVPMVVAVAFLCFRTTFSLDRSTATQSKYAILATTLAAMYMLNTGFSAINVQLAPQPTKLYMSARDLTQQALDSDDNLEVYAGIQRMPLAATADKSLREDNATNLLTNTILRNCILREELVPNPRCALSGHSWREAPVPIYGFPSRPWHSNALRESIPSNQTVKFVLQNSTVIKYIDGATTTDNDEPRELPMSKDKALNLALHSTVLAGMYLNMWDGEASFLRDVARDAVDEFFNPADAVSTGNFTGGSNYSLPLLDIWQSGPLANTSTDEDLIKYINKILLQFVSRAANVSATEVEVEFTRTDLAAGVTFDAITLEIPLLKNHFQRTLVYNQSRGAWEPDGTPPKNDDGDNFYEMAAAESCSQSMCVLPDSDEYSVNAQMIDPHIRPQIIAVGACWDDKAREGPDASFIFETNSSVHSKYVSVSCEGMSNTSMFSIGVGKRIQGDEITSRSVQQGSHVETIVSLKNARKVYSITVGLLSWVTYDLAELYGAECLRSSDTLCHGLSYKLQSTNPEQHLVVGTRRLSMNSLYPLEYFYPDTLSLVKTVDIGTSSSNTDYDRGLLVLPRNFKNVSWPSASDANNTWCSGASELFVCRTELSHLYIEKTLQPAYTAAFFYLFQDAAVRDVLEASAANHDADSVALAFLKNVQLIDVKLSSPLKNIISTLCGAAILFVLTIAILICASQRETKLQQTLDAHNFAEALINEQKFPPLLLKTMIDDNEVDRKKSQLSPNDGVEAASDSSLDGFRIERVVLTHPDGQQVVLDLQAGDRALV